MSSYGIAKDPETNNLIIVMDCSYGFCEQCMQPYTNYDAWSHQSCNARRFQQNFYNWTSGNNDIDEFIQNAQIVAESNEEVFEWIEYDRFENIEHLGKGEFGPIYKANWKDGCIRSWDSHN